ncbi:MAG: hypothetical protein WCP03_03745 [Candidatus Saccharibacteria bacterium]
MAKNTKIMILLLCIVSASIFYIVYKYLGSDYITVSGLIVGVLIPMIGLLAIFQTILVAFWCRGNKLTKKFILSAIVCILFVLAFWFLWFSLPGAASNCLVSSNTSFWFGDRCIQPQDDQDVLMSADCSLGNCDGSYADTNRYQPFIWAKIFSYLSLMINLVVSIILIWLPKRKSINRVKQ